MLSHFEKKRTAEEIRESVYHARGIQKLSCHGKCMVPILGDDVEVLVKDCLPDDLAIGDIILYNYNGRLMLHRFIYKKAKPDRAVQIVTKADINLRFDHAIGAGDLIGKVIEIDRNGKKIKIEKLPWLLSFRITGIMSLMEVLVYGMTNKIKRKFFANKMANYRNRRIILQAIKKPKLLFTRITMRFMYPSRSS